MLLLLLTGYFFFGVQYTQPADPFIGAIAQAETASLTQSETAAFRGAIVPCWNVDPGSRAAAITLDVSFALAPDGRVQGDITMVSASGGNDEAVQDAFQAARRAILRCGADGYDLPMAKYASWQNIALRFDPSGVRVR